MDDGLMMRVLADSPGGLELHIGVCLCVVFSHSQYSHLTVAVTCDGHRQMCSQRSLPLLRGSIPSLEVHRSQAALQPCVQAYSFMCRRVLRRRCPEPYPMLSSADVHAHHHVPGRC